MSQSGNRLGLTFAVLGAVGFSFKAILIKLAYPYGVDAVTLLALRMGLSLPFFLALGWADQRRRQPVPLAGRDWGLMLGLGFSGYYLASYLDFLGLQYISAALERLILFAYPTLVVLFSALFLGKPITRRAAGSIALCYAGIALAVAHDLDLGGDAHEVWLGGALVFGSAVSYALYLMGNGQAVGRLGAARHGDVGAPRAKEIHSLSDRVGTRGAGRHLREGRAIDAEPHGHVGRRFVRDHEGNGHWRHALRTRFQKLGERILEDVEAADAVSEADRRAFAVIAARQEGEREAVFTGFGRSRRVEACVAPGLNGGGNRVLREQRHFSGFLLVHPKAGIEVLHFGGDLGFEPRGVEARDGACAGLALEQR